MLCILSAVSAKDMENKTVPHGMVLVPAGHYAPLFHTKKEPKQIPVPAFLLDVIPVTNGEFLDFVRVNRNGNARR
ncbi:MAG TPA: hypothetical protein VK530_14960 [Candidatus Acidoferrum sp.]|nr:hypothetical protein [Candidatus Acidoferrum sp.]